MPRELYNSPEKKWIRENFWLSALRQFVTQEHGDVNYLTFAGPDGHDIELFCNKYKLVKLENVRVWEKSEKAAKRLSQKYGAPLQIKQGDAVSLCRSRDEQSFFPYQLVNFDFTSGGFYLERPRWTPQKFETIASLIDNQRNCASSFLLFLALAVSPHVDNDLGRVFIDKVAFDLATRLGRPQPLFNLTRNIAKTYPDTLSEIVPCAVIRIGGERNFDTECIGKAVYRPFRSRKTIILSLIFSFTYDHPALSQSCHQVIARMDEIARKRQHESFSVPLINVNKIVKPRRRKRR